MNYLPFQGGLIITKPRAHFVIYIVLFCEVFPKVFFLLA